MPLMLFSWKFNCGGRVIFGSVLHTAKGIGEEGKYY